MFSKNIDLYLGSDLGKWVDQNFNWEYGHTHKAWEINFQAKDYRISRQTGFAGISVHWPEIFTRPELESYRFFFNIHPGYIPLGRGYYPIFWAIFQNSIAGSTIHQMTEEIDFGPILFREKVDFDLDETEGHLRKRILEIEKGQICDLLSFITKFPSYIPLVQPNPNEKGLLRKKSDFLKIRDFGSITDFSSHEIVRLRLAFTNDEHTLPSWLIP